MRSSQIEAIAALLLSVATHVQGAPHRQTDYVQEIQDQAFAALEDAEPIAQPIRGSECTLETAGVRKNW